MSFLIEQTLADLIAKMANAGEIHDELAKNLFCELLWLLEDRQRLNWLLTEATAEQLSALPEWSREAIDTAMERCQP